MMQEMVAEEITRRAFPDSDVAEALADARMLRMAGIFRARFLHSTRLIRKVPGFRDGRLLLLSLGRACGFFLWAVVISFAMAYVVGLVLAHGALGHCTNDADANSFLCEKFGTLWRSCFTIIQAMLGGIHGAKSLMQWVIWIFAM